MSKGKGPTEASAHFNRERQNIHISTDIAVRQPVQSGRVSIRIPVVATVVVTVIAMAAGDCLWNARAAVATQFKNRALLVAQNQDSAAPPDDSVPPSQQEATPPAAQASVAPHVRTASRSERNDHLSRDLSDYLHQHHLPFVDANVFCSGSGRPNLVRLSGQVRTEHGKEDAETKSDDFLNQPGLRMQNHIEVDAGLTSGAPASSSGSVVPASSPGSAAGAPMAAAPAIATNPCADMCLKDEGHCNTTCQTQAAGGATGGGFSLQALAGQFGQSATALKQCNDQCVQTREHCSYDCNQAASAGPPPDGAESSGPQLGNSDHRSEGPDTPPE
jgi:hypothetical protein